MLLAPPSKEKYINKLVCDESKARKIVAFSDNLNILASQNI